MISMGRFSGWRLWVWVHGRGHIWFVVKLGNLWCYGFVVVLLWVDHTIGMGSRLWVWMGKWWFVCMTQTSLWFVMDTFGLNIFLLILYK